MGYWCAAQLQTNREGLALHMLEQIEGFTVYAPRLRQRRRAGTSAGQIPWPSPGAGNIMPPGFGGGGRGGGGIAGAIAGFGGGAGGGAAGGVAGLTGGPSGPAAARDMASLAERFGAWPSAPSAGIGGGAFLPWAATVAPGAGGAYEGQPVETPPGWGSGTGAGVGGGGGKIEGSAFLQTQRASRMAELQNAQN